MNWLLWPDFSLTGAVFRFGATGSHHRGMKLGGVVDVKRPGTRRTGPKRNAPALSGGAFTPVSGLATMKAG